MRHSGCCSVLSCIALSGILIMLASCSGNGKKIGEFEERVKKLEASGAPDSILSNVHLDLANAKNGDRTGISIREYLDSLKVHLETAEKWSATALQADKVKADALIADITAKKATLSGAQLRVADSMLAIVESYGKKGWFLQECQTADRLDSTMVGLLNDEEIAKKVAAQIPGSWAYTEHEGKALHKTKISFLKDGSFEMNESMNGETSSDLKEDWEYHTNGGYGIKGDTVNLMVNREKLVHQTFWNLDSTNQWKKREI